MGVFLGVADKTPLGEGFLVYQHSTKQLLPTSGINRSDMLETVSLSSRLGHDITNRCKVREVSHLHRCFQQIQNHAGIKARANDNVISFLNCLRLLGKAGGLAGVHNTTLPPLW